LKHIHSLQQFRITAFFILTFTFSFSVAQQRKTCDWLLIYYLPYDNDLSPLADTIIRQCLSHTFSGSVCMTIQTDLAGDGGMKRFSIDKNIDSVHVAEENSGSAEGFSSYLHWVVQRYRAKHIAIVLLNHGGDLNEYGLDTYPEKSWIKVSEVAHVIREFNDKMNIAKIDLLYQQVCTRGTIENIYEFNDVAKFTLASQDLVPAPNYYYAKVFKTMDRNSPSDGKQLAELIVSSERDDMYYSYTLIDNSQWQKWEKALRDYIHTIKKNDIYFSTDQMKIITYRNTLYFDLNSFVSSTKYSGSDSDAHAFRHATDILISKHWVNPAFDRMKDYCGISICSPFSHQPDKSLSIFRLQAYADWMKFVVMSRSAR
jgi:hypothetical protein